jgi:AraC-like DNA-binding protein
MNTGALNLNIDQIEKDSFAVHLRVGRFHTTWHTHFRHQLLYAEDGVLHLQTDQHHFLLPARHAAWIPGRCKHRVYSDSPDLYMRTLYLQAQEDDDTGLQQLRVFPVSNLAREMILHTQTWNWTLAAGPLERSFFQTIRLLVPTWYQNAIPLILPSTDHPHLNLITQYLRKNLAEPLQLETTANRFGFSGRTLLRLFKKELGMTFGTYLRVARIILALELLTRPGVSVAEVAYAVGYDSPSSFSQTFSHLVGVSPQAYRKDLSPHLTP